MEDIILPIEPQGNLFPKTTFIYCLKDPRDDAVRYIGKANDPEKRLKGHIYKAKHETTHKGYWIMSLLSLGLAPIMQIIEEVPFSDWKERETYYIHYYFEHGHPLTNILLGSEGLGIIPPESRAKISAAHKGRKKAPFSEEWRRKLGDVSRGKKQSPEHIAKRTSTQRGSKHTPESIAKMSAAKQGKTRSPETHAKILAIQATPEYKQKQSVAHRGKKATPEHKAKLAAAGRGRQVSSETREKLAAANRGRECLPETRAKLSDANKGTAPPNKGIPMSEEQKEKLSLANLGKKPSPESRAKTSMALRGRKQSPEQVAKRVASRKRTLIAKDNPPNTPTLWD